MINQKDKLEHIGLGTAAIGRPQYINLRQTAVPEFTLDQFKKNGKEVLESAYESGIRYFDTAPGYGMAESLILEWIQEKEYHDVEIATKWGYTYVANFDPQASVHEVKEHSLSKLKEQWEYSKQLLPYMKNYQIHSATLESGVLTNQEVLTFLNQLKNEYGLRIGITASGDRQKEIIEKALEITFDGQALFDLYQVTYNILEASLAKTIISLQKQNTKVVIKEAMANGRIFPNSDYPHYESLYQRLKELSKKYGVGIDAIPIRYCLDSVKPFMVLSGGSQKKHVDENLLAASISLEENEIKELQQFAVDTEFYWSERKKLAWN